MWPFKNRHAFQNRQPSIDSKKVEGPWSRLQGHYEGRLLLVRLNTGLQSVFAHPHYSYQVGIAVSLHTPDHNGMPTMEEGAELYDIEDILTSQLEYSNKCLFAAVISTNAMREFVFYTGDPEGVTAIVTGVQKRISDHDLQLMIQPDSEWNVYKTLQGS